MNSLKKIVYNKNTVILLIQVVFFSLGMNKLQAQIQNNGAIYISDNASLYSQSSTFSFGTESSTETSRSVISYGNLIFGATATTSAATSGVNSFVNGHARTFSNTYFILPLGSTTYAPIGITNAQVTAGVGGVYNSGPPNNSGNLDNSVTALNSGSWNVYGDNSKLTLIWRDDISTLSNAIANLTVAGYRLSTNKWEAISSAMPTGNLSAGTIQTSSAVTLSSYSAFTLAKKGYTCSIEAPAMGVNGPDVTWNGTWSSTPDLTSKVTLLSNGSPGSFNCYSLNVNGNTVSFSDGQSVLVGYEIYGSGLIKLSNEASIFQINDSSTFTTPVEITKGSRSGMFAYDYIYAGSPLTSNSFSQIANAQAYNLANTTATGVSGAFDLLYKYVSGDVTTTGGWQTLTSTSPGKGFIMRIKQQAPYSAFGNASANHINIKFSGTANNGVITTPVLNSLTSPTSARNNNLLANPFPSAIDADKFLEYNTNLDGVVYIWKSQTASSGVPGSSYTAGDYIAYTRAGVTADNSIGTLPFDGKIASGQGFLVKSNFSIGTGNATFNNCMRVALNGTFLRTSTIVNRFKLNLKGANNVGNQILIAYMPESTLEYDRMYDAELNSVSPAQMYSTLDNSAMQLGINARPIFNTTDIVALGIDKSNTNPENFSISISNKEGVFQSDEINVLLHDKLLNVYHNLANSDYNFTSNTTQLSNRLEIVYQQTILGNSEIIAASFFATFNNKVLKIKSSLPITKVTVFDISGRLITNLTIDNQLEVNNQVNYALGIYIVKIKLNNGETTTQKLINK